jgi:DEAD/DEAH box helicase domain-containing protein
LQTQPRPLGELAQELTNNLPLQSREQTFSVLNSLCALIACARDPAQPKQTLVQLRLQLWTRELRRIVCKVVPGKADNSNSEENASSPELAFADDLKQQRDELYLPLAQCNDCHATAWVTCKPESAGQVRNDLREIYNAFFGRSPDLILLFPLLPDEQPPAAEGVIQRLCGSCGQLQSEHKRCAGCGDEQLIRVFRPNNTRERQRDGIKRLVSEHHCPVCGAQHNLSIFGARAASLASVAIHHGYASPYNDDKKLIAFSDSVQDAAHRAGFFNARTRCRSTTPCAVPCARIRT